MKKVNAENTDTYSGVKCPYCGGETNWKKFTHWNGDVACFIAECWTPKNEKAPRHLYKIFVVVDKEAVIDEQKFVGE